MSGNGAIESTAAGDSAEAVRLYEQEISKTTDLSTYVDYAVFCWACTDPGYYSAHHLSGDFINWCSARAYALLDEAEARYGYSTEVSFWRYYFKHIDVGTSADEAQCIEWIREGCDVPCFHMISRTRDSRYLECAKRLMSGVRGRRTAREEYIYSVISSVTATLGSK